MGDERAAAKSLLVTTVLNLPPAIAAGVVVLREVQGLCAPHQALRTETNLPVT